MDSAGSIKIEYVPVKDEQKSKMKGFGDEIAAKEAKGEAAQKWEQRMKFDSSGDPCRVIWAAAHWPLFSWDGPLPKQPNPNLFQHQGLIVCGQREHPRRG